ncbi:zinc ABC transporter substrate-binding protein ZnuA [Labrenzia suaedae]|uniref:High-affinity zinc uptake system protein ZnuA n=1 Tax=Roseibium litorale TaxID=2803841 RepID=A0ABR9CV17_9HYPH|nr:zinc ABC transporter substrate-binding protein ZnuA [Roseibium litorale]MBD8894359.1 zinc ABC transporter substrate-binding protein ZnuA [Roseibium litorale]
MASILGLATALSTASAAAAFAGAPKVVTTIKPLQSLAASIMEGVGTPTVLIDGAASPHGYSLKPSQAAQLQNANVVFWIGESLETSLEKPLDSLAGKADVVELMQAKGLHLVPFRLGNGFGPHVHEGEGGDHDDHDHDAGHEAAHDEHGHGEEGHHHEGTDPHLWLDPENARIMAEVMADHLAAADPANAGTYRANFDKLNARLSELEAEIKTELEPAHGKTFVVFHDAYHYFEDRFGLAASGSITLNPESPPGADRLNEIQQRIKTDGVVCVFGEPQFEPKLVSVVLEGTDARMATLDPLGTGLTNGPGLYEQLLKGIAKTMTNCLTGK